MEEQFTQSIQLQCVSCNSTDINFIEESTKIKCNNCGRIYHGGIDEIVELSKDSIEKEVEKKLETEISNMLKNAFKGNKNIKIK
jgi:ribosomal protein S27E